MNSSVCHETFMNLTRTFMLCSGDDWHDYNRQARPSRSTTIETEPDTKVKISSPQSDRRGSSRLGGLLFLKNVAQKAAAGCAATGRGFLRELNLTSRRRRDPR